MNWSKRRSKKMRNLEIQSNRKLRKAKERKSANHDDARLNLSLYNLIKVQGEEGCQASDLFFIL